MKTLLTIALLLATMTANAAKFDVNKACNEMAATQAQIHQLAVDGRAMSDAFDVWNNFNDRTPGAAAQFITRVYDNIDATRDIPASTARRYYFNNCIESNTQ